MRPGQVGVSTRAHRSAAFAKVSYVLLVLVALSFWPATASAQLSLARIPLATNDLVYDAHSARVYASVPASEPNGNSIAVIDPATATVVTFIPIGAEPNQLAVSGDGQYLYVGLDGSGSVSVVDLATLTRVQEFPLGGDTFGRTYTAVDLAVSPGQSGVVVAALQSASWMTEIRLFEGGVQLGREWSSSGEGVLRLAFLTPGSVVAAGNSGRAYTFVIDEAGLTQTGSVNGVLTGAGDLRVAGGKVYNAAGSVWDPTAVESTTRFEGIESMGPFVVDDTRFTAAFVGAGSGSYILAFYDTRTYLPVSSYEIPLLSFVSAAPYQAASCGDRRLAFRDDTQVVIATVPERPMHVLRVNLAGTGTGSVTSSNARLYCGLNCTDLVPEATPVDLVALPDEGAVFEGWGGDEDCLDGRVTMSASRSCTANFSSSSATLRVRRLGMRGRDLAVLPGSGHLLVSVAGSEPEIGNGIVEIDPATGQVVNAKWLGGGPGRLAVSDDGQRLYAAQTWSPGLLDVKLDTGEAARYDLGRDTWRARTAVDLAVQPGHPEVVAVADAFEYISVWAAGTKRPTTADIEGPITFGAPDTLYVSAFALHTLAVAESGVTDIGLSYGFGALSRPHYADGLIYYASGIVTDPVTGTWQAKYDLGDAGGLGVAPAPESARIYFLALPSVGGRPQLLTYDMASGSLLSRVAIETSETFASGDGPTVFVRAGTNQVAFLTREALYVVDVAPLGALRTLTLTTPTKTSTVWSSTGLRCTSSCSELVPVGTTVTLSASAEAGFVFGHWEGDEDCADGIVTMTANRSCRAFFLAPRTPGDIDGDGRSDLVLWNSQRGIWTWTLTSSGQTSVQSCGSRCIGNVAVMGDYDLLYGLPTALAASAETATWRPSNGMWYLDSPYIQCPWGRAGDVPVPGDYDGDGITDLAGWRPGNGIWYVLLSSEGYMSTASLTIQWGANGDKPMPGDYDGDGRTDLAVWRPATGYWKILLSSKGYAPGNALSIQWGSSAAKDVLVPADFDGDGKSDLAVWRPGNGTWYVLRSSLNFASSSRWTAQFGASTDTPSPLDYDGDHKADPVVWRASTGTWLILQSSSGYATKATVKPTTRGGTGDAPAHDYR